LSGSNFFREILIKSFAHYSGVAVTFFSPEKPAHDGPGKASARRDIKEVTAMSTITNTWTVETQPAFGMPVYGRASVPSFGTADCAPTTVSISVQAIGNGRDRHVAALVKGALPGTSVWRPPNC